jgi:type IV/VI secretion system ImpK/VasF family protein
VKLSEITRELFEFIVSFRRAVESRGAPDIHAVRQDLEKIFETMEARLEGDASLRGEYDQVKYALVAMADESILNSSWSEARKWDRYLLEQKYFSTNIAGNQFFKMLERVDQMSKEVIKIFYICLAFGFRGGFSADDPSLLRLRSRLLQRFMPEKEDATTMFFPDAYHVQVGNATKLPPLWHLWHVVLGVFLLTLVLVIIESFVVWPLLVGNLDQTLGVGPGSDSRNTTAQAAIPSAEPTNNSARTTKGYLVQHGRYASLEEARARVSQLGDSQIVTSIYLLTNPDAAQRHVVAQGPLPSIESASKVAEETRAKVGSAANVTILDATSLGGSCVEGCAK